MPVQSDDRILWIILGGGLLIAANAIPYYLKYLRTLTQTDPDDDEGASKGPCERAEDRLKLSTLKKLAYGSSYKLRSSAIKIIAERSTRNGSRTQLLRDVASTNPVKRDRALNALWLLSSHPSLKESQGISQLVCDDVSTFAAVIECLVNLLPLHENKGRPRADNPTAASPLLPPRRPPPETLALRIVDHLLSCIRVPQALEAGLISKWLKVYPFPCALPENGGRRQDVVKYLNSWGDDDPLMSSIIRTIKPHPGGLAQLLEYGLTDSSYVNAKIDLHGLEAITTNPAATITEDRTEIVAVATTMTTTTTTRTSTRTSSLEPRPHPPSWHPRRPNPTSTSTSLPNQAERAARQRRREAAVYSEGNGPLTQDNIFQRQSSSSSNHLTTRLPPPPTPPPPPPQSQSQSQSQPSTDLDIETELRRLSAEIEREEIQERGW